LKLAEKQQHTVGYLIDPFYTVPVAAYKMLADFFASDWGVEGDGFATAVRAFFISHSSQHLFKKNFFPPFFHTCEL
jgi:hypothetical protein